jgi:hypothetical protein
MAEHKHIDVNLAMYTHEELERMLRQRDVELHDTKVMLNMHAEWLEQRNDLLERSAEILDVGTLPEVPGAVTSMKAALAASEGRAKRLEEALEQIGLNLCYCEALGDEKCFPCMALDALDALAEPAADKDMSRYAPSREWLLEAAEAGGGPGFLALAEASCTCGSVRCIPCRARDFYREIEATPANAGEGGRG